MTNDGTRRVISAFMSGFRHVSRRKCIRTDKKLRASLGETKIDQMVEDSFPASDPPSTY